MKNNKNDGLVPIVFFGVACLLVALVFLLKGWFDIDTVTAFSTAIRLVLLLAVVVIAYLLDLQWDVRLRWFMPIFVVVLYMSFFPIFDYWSAQRYPFNTGVAWYASSFTHFFVIMGVLGLGYFLVYKLSKD